MGFRKIRLRERSLESLGTLGFAVENFPSYSSSPEGSPFHEHDVMEANFIVSGDARHCIDNVERRCSAGSLGIVTYGQKHVLDTGGKSIEVINLYFDPENYRFPDLPSELSAVVESLFPVNRFPGTPHGLVSFLTFRNPAPMTSLLRYCCYELEERDTGYLSVLESALRMILISCARQALSEGVETLATDQLAWSSLEQSRLNLEQDFLASHTLENLAKTARMSTGHFCRSFKAYTGLSPIEYLAQRRIRAAMQALRNSSRKVSDIAYSCGFGDIGHFNRKFKQVAECSPREYRKRFF